MIPDCTVGVWPRPLPTYRTAQYYYYRTLLRVFRFRVWGPRAGHGHGQ
jgi:hypothetical protein